MTIYPNKNRTKTGRIRTFLPALIFYSGSRKNMGLQVKKFTDWQVAKYAGFERRFQVGYVLANLMPV